MKLLLVLLLTLFAYVQATSTIRSVLVYATNSTYKGRLIGTNTTTNANCSSARPATCISSTTFSLLARSDLKLADIPVNQTVPVIWYTNSLIMAVNWRAMWTLAQGTSWYIQTAVVSIMGSVGANQTYWTGAGANGEIVDLLSSCGGNWTINNTANVGLTATNDVNWMNYTQLSCELSRPFLCACNSYTVPIQASLNTDMTWAVVVGVIAVVVVIALVMGMIFNVKKNAGKMKVLND